MRCVISDLLHTSHTPCTIHASAAGSVATRNSITRFHAHAHLVRKIATSEIWEIIPHLAYMKIMHAEYLVCNKHYLLHTSELNMGSYFTSNAVVFSRAEGE